MSHTKGKMDYEQDEKYTFWVGKVKRWVQLDQKDFFYFLLKDWKVPNRDFDLKRVPLR